MTRNLSPKQRRWLRRAAWVLGIYTVFGFLILPLIVKAVATSQLHKLLDREVTIRSLRINPYALSITVRGFLVKDKDGEPLLSWDEFHVNFELRSLIGKSWVFKEVRLLQPFARVQINKDRSLNFSDLVADNSEPKPKEEAKSGPFLLRVGKLDVKGARVSFADLTPSMPFRRMIGPLDVSLSRFHTDPENKNPYSFSGTTDSGESFSWSGYFFLNPIHSAGHLAFSGISLPKYTPLFKDLVRFELRGGLVDFSGDYRFGMGLTNYEASVSNAAFALHSFKLANLDAAENLVELDSFSITNADVDAAGRAAEVGAVLLDGARLALKRASNATINFVEAGKPAENATNAPGGVLFLLHAATNAFSALLHSTNLWSATLHELLVTNSAVRWDDDANRRPVRLPVEEIRIEARNVSNLPGTNMTLDVSFRWNTNGTFALQSSTSFQPPSMDVALKIESLELWPLGPYLDPVVNLYVLDNKLGLNGDIRMLTAEDGLPAVTFKGDIRMDDFATEDGVMNEDLLKWKSFAFSGVNASLNPPVVAVKEISLVEPFVLLAVQTNKALNMVSVMRTQPTNATPAVVADASTTTNAPEPKLGIGRQLGRLIRRSLTASTNEDDAATAPKISVDVFAMTNATIRYADYSVTPHVKAGFRELSGSITAISSTGLQPSELHFAGKVGAGGTFDIAGHIHPLTTNSETDLKIVIKDVDLAPMSPYSAKYLGWRLNRGALNFDTDYVVSERKFTAKNVLMLDQLTFGKRVSSPDATKLPVRLAVGVLKDSEGKILLDVPIEGSLDDPQMRFGRVISRAIVNIVVKIATSPFSLLGSVFGGKGDEVSFLDFSPGSAELNPATVSKLDRLLNGLAQKPGLNLAIEGSLDPARDEAALRLNKLNARFKQQKWNSLRKGAQEEIKVEDVVVSIDERAAFLQEAYNALIATIPPPQPATTNSAVAAPPNFPAKAAVTVMQTINPPPTAPVPDMERVLLAAIEVPKAELHQLAAVRAQQVLQRLIDSARIDPDRLSIASLEDINPGEPAARVYFHLQ